MNFPLHIFFNDIIQGYRAAILKKKFLWLLASYMVWLLISIMKRCAERCALQLYQTSLRKSKTVILEQFIDPYSGRLVENITITFSPDFQSVFNKKTFMLYFGQTELYSSLLERFTGI